jgi:hypothetical protein
LLNQIVDNNDFTRLSLTAGNKEIVSGSKGHGRGGWSMKQKEKTEQMIGASGRSPDGPFKIAD